MKIAITGAGGFLANYLIKELLKEKSNELFLFTSDYKKAGSEFGDNKFCHLLQTDYTKASLFAHFEKYDCLIHLASKRYMKEQADLDDYKINIEISRNLYDKCSEFEVKNIVFTSSRLVYSSKASTRAFIESDVAEPENPYAKSKVEIEKMAEEYDLNIKTLRLSQLAGWGEREGFLVTTFIQNAMLGKPITIFGDGKNRRAYIYAKDAVSAIRKAILLKDVKDIFNIGNSISTSNYEFALLCSEVFGNGKIEIKFEPAKAFYQTDTILDIEKARQILHWEPKYSLREALIDMKNDLKK